MNFKFRSIFKDLFLTLTTETVVVLCFFFLYKIIAENYGTDGVGKYSLIKKTVGFLQPLLLLGLSTGIPTYVAISRSKDQRSAYLKAGGLIVASTTLVFFILVGLFKEEFSAIFFGSADYHNFVLPFFTLLAGLTLHAFIYSYFRGRLFVKIFNIIQLINVGLVPVVVLLIFKKVTIEEVMTLMGFFTLVTVLVFSLFLVKDIFSSVSKKQLMVSAKELLHYSFPRFVAGFVYSGLLSLSVIFAAHFSSMSEVGYLSISQSLLSVFGTVTAPMGIILLPKVGSMMMQKREKELKENLNHLIEAIIQCSIFIAFQLIIFADVIVKYWLGSEFLNAALIMRIVFISVVFLFFHGTMANVLEAEKTRPINLINACRSLGVFLFLSVVLIFMFKDFPPIISLSIAFSAGMACLGTLTYISIRKIYPEKIEKDLYPLLIAIGINLFFGGAAIFARLFIGFNFYYLIIFEILMSFIYLAILFLLKAGWIRQLPKIILEKYA